MLKVITIKFFVLLFFISFASFGQSDTIMYIIVTAGQSNMSGRAAITPQDTITYPNVFNLTKDSVWVKAKNPIHFDSPSAGVGPVMSCIKELLNKHGNKIKIGIVPCAVGSTTVENWLYNSNIGGVFLYNNLITRAKFANKFGKIIGVLWHQGEQNGAPWVYNDYKFKLKSIFNNIRKDLNDPYLPIVAGELGDFYLSSLYYEYKNYINIDINSLKTELKNVGVASANGLVSKGDNLHFNTESQHILGYRYAQSLLPLLKYLKTDSVSTYLFDTLEYKISFKDYLADSIKSLHFQVAFDTNYVSFINFKQTDTSLLKENVHYTFNKGLLTVEYEGSKPIFLQNSNTLFNINFKSIKSGLTSPNIQNAILNDTVLIKTQFNGKIFSRPYMPNLRYDSVKTIVSKKASVKVYLAQEKPSLVKSFSFNFVYDTLFLKYKNVVILDSRILSNKLNVQHSKDKISIHWSDSIPLQFSTLDSILKINFISLNEGVTQPIFENVYFDSLKTDYNVNTGVKIESYYTYIQSDWVVETVFNKVKVPVIFSQTIPQEINSFSLSVNFDTSKVQFQKVIITDSILANNGVLNFVKDTLGNVNINWVGDYPIKKYDSFIPFTLEFLTINDGISFSYFNEAYIDSFPVTSINAGAIVVQPYLPTISFDSVKTIVDDDFKIPFYINQKQIKDVTFFQFSLNYDENEMTFKKYNFKDSIDFKGDVEFLNENGKITISWTGTSLIKGSSVIDVLDLYFKSNKEGFSYPTLSEAFVNNYNLDTFLNGNVFAEKHLFSVGLDTSNVKVGQIADLNLSISQLNPIDFNKMSFQVTFDTLALKYEGYELKNDSISINNHFKINKNIDGTLLIKLESDSGFLFLENKLLSTLKFKSLIEGNYNITVFNLNVDDHSQLITKNGLITSEPILPKLEVGNIITKINKTFSLPINISQINPKEINQFSFEIVYDSLKIDLLSYTFIKDNTLKINKEAGKVLIEWSGLNGFSALSNFEIIKLNFIAKDSGNIIPDFRDVLINNAPIDTLQIGNINIQYHYSNFVLDSIINGFAKKTIYIPIYSKQINPEPINSFKAKYYFNSKLLNYQNFKIINQNINEDSLSVICVGDTVKIDWKNSLINIPAVEFTELISLQFYPKDTFEISTELTLLSFNSFNKNSGSKQQLDINYQYGDVNNDNSVNEQDAQLLLNYSVGLINDTIDWSSDVIADVNFSDKITSSDASSILQYNKGSISSFTKAVDLNSKIRVIREGNNFVFSSIGDLYSLNLSFDNNLHLLNSPTDFYNHNNLIYAENVNDTIFNIALASATAIDSGTVLFKIPYNELESALYTFNLKVNNSIQKVIFDLILPISKVDAIDEKVEIFPNYNQNQLIIRNYPENAKIVIFNPQGIEIYKCDNLNQAIYINDLPRGLLIIKVENNVESFTTKIIIEK
ncbi:MAG: hypothetical protein RLZZ175_2097 [Bacteroidota bacterium]|jgi:hypothetical protein